MNAANANVGQNSAMWPPAAGANPGLSRGNAKKSMNEKKTYGILIEYFEILATTTATPLQPPQIVNPALGQDVRNVAGNQMDIRNADPRDIRISNGYVLSTNDVSTLMKFGYVCF